MIKANKTWLGIKFFEIYSSFQLKRHFDEIYFEGSFVDSGKSILLISNHFSWWDGFIQILLNKQFLKRNFHVMMLEEQLQQHMILNKAGAFSIKKNCRSTIESLNYSVDLLLNPDNLVLIFPQGEIQSIYTQAFGFEKGLQYILRQLGSETQIVFNVNLIDYFSNKKPSLTGYYENYSILDDLDIKTLETAFNGYTNECIRKQISI